MNDSEFSQSYEDQDTDSDIDDYYTSSKRSISNGEITDSFSEDLNTSDSKTDPGTEKDTEPENKSSSNDTNSFSGHDSVVETSDNEAGTCDDKFSPTCFSNDGDGTSNNEAGTSENKLSPSCFSNDDDVAEEISCIPDVYDSSSDDIDIVEKSLTIVEVSDDNDDDTHILGNLPKSGVPENLNYNQQVNKVSQLNYQEQKTKVQQLENELLRAKNTVRIINLENLPDKGRSLLEKVKNSERLLAEEKSVLDQMTPPENDKLENRIPIAWDEIEAGVEAVAPRTFGKKGIERFHNEKQLAMETLDNLHKSLDKCPKENDSVPDPIGLKVNLMPHQGTALAWLLWREQQTPSGGLLADDMGLGKTLTMISLIMKSKELECKNEKNDKKYSGGTLVVCPASLLNQWSGEIDTKTKRGVLSYQVHHGPKRETKARRLAEYDVIITTYALALSEYTKNAALFGVDWRRIILDEAHQIRNFKSQTAEAIFTLSGKSRWALTGTPVHNKELDMYAQLKFLRCAPFDNLQVWKHWVGDKSTGGQLRLHAVISSLMLRRTKDELISKGSLQSLPDRKWELIPIKLDKDEMGVYQKVLIFSRTLFAQFLHQRAEKRQDAYDLKFNGLPPDPNNEYFKMRNKLLKLNKVKEVNQHDILVLLLRLRQICCHPSLITQMLHGDEDLGNADDDEESEEINLLDQLNKLDINDDEDHVSGLSNEPVGLKEASKGYLNPSNPVFSKNRKSSKFDALIKLLKDKIPKSDKVIIVSQWTSLLNLIGEHLRDEMIGFDYLTGAVAITKRMPIIDKFNDPTSDVKVLLLSLTAGGVGLNLVGANHLFLLDLHWNPQLENQAQDRIYRMGQKKTVFIYKLMAEGTIEEKIKLLQENKLEIANSMLTGSKKVSNSKLTLQDLKMLFGF